MNREIYLDNSATTKPLNEVVNYINTINTYYYGNPSSLHSKGIEAEKLVKKARQAIADSLNADAKEMVFTSGGTEANNLAILGYLEANPRKGRHVITSSIEHPSVLEVFKYLEGKGYSVDYIKVGANGIIDVEDLRSKINDNTALISIMHVNNEVGSLQPVEEIARIRNSVNREAVLHVDAVQAYGKIKITPRKSGIDMLSASSHKIHGPKGVGALYVSRNIRIKPILLGGGQESLLRSGTENVSGIGGFGLASETVLKSIDANYSAVGALKEKLLKALKENLEAFTPVSPEEGLPYILSLSFESVRSEVLLHHLEERGIFVSAGSACSSRKNVHSHVLKAMGFKTSNIEGTIRISLSPFNTEEDIYETVEALKEIIPRIKVTRKG